MSKLWIGLLGVLVGAACVQLTDNEEKQSSQIRLLEKHILDFNQHNTEALIANMDPSFGWYQVENDSISVEANSIESLREGMDGYFSGLPSVQSRIGETLSLGAYLATVETVQWKNKSGETRSQASLSVYQIEQNKIKNVWYFPAVSHENH